MSNDGRVNEGCTLLSPSLHFVNDKNMNKLKAEDNPWIKKTGEKNDAERNTTPSHKKGPAKGEGNKRKQKIITIQYETKTK